MLSRGLGNDTGSESVGLALLFPVVLLLILSAVQGGLWWYAHAVASQAAQAGVDAGRPVGATNTTAVQSARSFAARAGSGVLAAPEAQAVVTADNVQVTVSGSAPRLLPMPGLDIEISATARAVKERFTVPLAAGGGS
ncbi:MULTISPECIES: TadE/TadG family type IV pilus assembly protein [Prauserella]|uniref:Pilus assembly protein TadE n=2 Tax=Prauserella TaxID=142577 RepID=A0A318LCQ0_9PSEU|nr:MULTISPECIES: TadE family protein [Prauserella]PXY17743.1 pilus assembly protein TadE [Prauserella flavalba]PXY18649.1 pilus assembly protein TadE [Prauserella coralliicola]TKG63582.1 pilus assembly protein [Prauserella endophytica]